MNGSTSRRRHSREDLERFLDRDFRQVWALDRRTGERLFIEPGTADTLRDEAKAHWRCPAAGCTAPITIAGKTKRDHLRHLPGTPCTGGGPESLWHLQGKAMLAEWAEQQPVPVDVVEEQTLKDPATAAYRRADVMVTWPAGDKVAFEVEYKHMDPEQLVRKHDQYRDLQAGCAWLFGHTHIRLEARPERLAPDEPWDLMRWTPQLLALAARGVPLLFINPITRQVGTAYLRGADLEAVKEVGRTWWDDTRQIGDRLPDAQDEWNVLQIALDDLDDCVLDPVHGLASPTMRRIADGRQAIEEAAGQARERWERGQAARDAAEAAVAAKRAAREADDLARQARAEGTSAEARREFALLRKQHDAAAWQLDPLRDRILAEFEGHIPGFLADRGREDWGVYGHPEAWHSHLFEQLVLGGPERSSRVGRVYTVPQAYAIVGGRFTLSPKTRYRSEAICSFLWLLDGLGYLRCEELPNGAIDDITVRASRIKPPPREVAPAAPSALEAGLRVLREYRATNSDPKPAPNLLPHREPPLSPAPLSEHACRICGSDLSTGGHASYCSVPPAEFYQAAKI